MELRFGTVRAPHAVEWLSDDGNPFIAERRSSPPLSACGMTWAPVSCILEETRRFVLQSSGIAACSGRTGSEIFGAELHCCRLECDGFEKIGPVGHVQSLNGVIARALEAALEAGDD